MVVLDSFVFICLVRVGQLMIFVVDLLDLKKNMKIKNYNEDFSFLFFKIIKFI